MRVLCALLRRVHVIKAPFGIIIPPSSYVCARVCVCVYMYRNIYVWGCVYIRGGLAVGREKRQKFSIAPAAENPRGEEKKKMYTNIFKTPSCDVGLYQDKLSE